MPPSIRFDQGDTGTVNESRSDIAIDTEVDVFALGVVGTAVFSLLDSPPGSASVFAGAGGDRQITPDTAGGYRCRIVDDNDGSKVIHTFTVRTAKRGLPIPTHNERASSDANQVDTDPGTWVNDSETNEGGSNKGWDPHDRELALAIEDSVPDVRTVTAGDGLAGGGDLTANRTLKVDLGDTTASATAQTSTVSTSDVLIDSMTITPAVAGDYLVLLTLSAEGDAENEDAFFNIYSGGAVVTPADHKPRRIDKNKSGPLVTIAVIARGVGVADAIEARWRTAIGETIFANTRRLDIIRIATP